MTEPPLLARALLRAAELLTPATDRVWVDAMRGDLDAAQAEGRALSWAFGCLVAAVRLRGAATFVLAPRQRAALFFLLAIMLVAATYPFGYHAFTGKWPFHGPVGYLLALLPFAAIGVIGMRALWRSDRPVVVDNRAVRGLLLLLVVAFGFLAASIRTAFAAGNFWTSLTRVLSTAPLVFAGSAVIGTLATLTAAIILCMNFRSLPARLTRVLPFERRFVYFQGADREKMLALADAGAPEMTLPRAWLIYSTVFPGFLLLQAEVQLLTSSIWHARGIGNERLLAWSCAISTVLCVANLLYVIAHVRFARHAR